MQIYKINDEKFKSIFISYNFIMPVEDKATFAKNAVLGALMAKSSGDYENQKAIEKYLNKMYGAYYDVSVDKYGDLYNLEFRVEFINRKFLPNKEELALQILNFLKSMIYNPADWKEENIAREKEFILERINERKDEKLKYGVQKMEELLCKDEPYGTYLYGNITDVENVDKTALKSAYDSVVKSNIVVMVSGNLEGYEDIDKVVESVFKDEVEKYGNDKKELSSLVLNTRKDSSINYEEVKEYQDTTQSVLTMGYKLQGIVPEDFYALSVYNGILGTTPSSKLFQNVREKASLCYTVRSKGYRFKEMIIVYAGINKENYSKAVELINKQVEDMRNGDISDIELNSTIDSMIADFSSLRDSKKAMASFLLSNVLAFGNSDTTLEQMIENFRKVTKEDVIRIAQKVNLDKVFYLGGDTNE